MKGENGGDNILDWSEINYTNIPKPIIDEFNYSKNIFDNWNNSTTDLESRFEDDRTIKYMPLVDTSNATNMSSMFYSCTNLVNVPLLNTENVVSSMNGMFYGCTSLVSVAQLNTSKTTGMRSMFTGCTKLSNETLNNILAMCINAKDITTDKNLRDIGLSSYQASVCQTLNNWSAFEAAGWTTGY